MYRRGCRMVKKKIPVWDWRPLKVNIAESTFAQGYCYGPFQVIRAYVAKRYFNSKATVDVQITALFLNSSPTVT